MRLYKYTQLKYIENSIKYGIYASKLDNVNDLYEKQGINYPERYRICCMASSYQQVIMWSYYTNHEGCCIEFEGDATLDNSGIVKTVKYSSTVPQRDDMNANEVFSSLYVKGRTWKHENEKRAVYFNGDYDKNLWYVTDHKNPKSDVFLRCSVKTVVLGLNAENDAHYKKSMDYLIRYNQNADSPIAIAKVKLGVYPKSCVNLQNSV